MDETTAPAAEETRAISLVTRDLTIRAESFNEAENTVEVCFTTGARGTRFDWRRYELIEEELSTDPAHVRLARLNAGGPVLNTHGSYELEDQIGVVEGGTARMVNGEGIATLRLSRRESVAPIVQDIRDRIIRNLSVGYRVHTYEITEREGQPALYRAVDWEPYEISFVPMPFDAGAQVRSGNPAHGGHPCILRRASPAITQETTMDPENQGQPGNAAPNDTTQTRNDPPQAPANPPAGQQEQRQAPATVTGTDVRTAARNAGLDADVTMDLLERHSTTPFTRDALMADIGRRFAERDSQAQTNGRISVTRDQGDTMRRGMGDALFHRMSPGGQLSDVGREFRGMSLLRMAEELLVSRGENVRGLSAHEIAERSLTGTSDLPALVGNGANRRLRAAYDENQPSYRRWTRRAPNAPNFKSIDVVQMSALPDLLRVNESGEVRFGSVSDGIVSYKVLTYARAVGLTRQMIVNDDLRALERVVTGFAGASARLENRTVYAILTSNPSFTNADGSTTPMFDAAHKNLAASGGAISATTLGDGRKRMRLQKGLQNEELNLMPSFLIAPASLEQVAYQFTSANYVPAKQTDTNEFRSGGRTAVEPIIEAVLDGASATAWYMAADPASCDTIEWCYLDGAEGPQMSSRVGFTTDGVEFKVTLDFAAAGIDWRGLDKNPG